MRPVSVIADASFGVSAASAAAAWLTPSGAAAAVAVIAGIYSIYDRWSTRRIKCPACRSLAREQLPE